MCRLRALEIVTAPPATGAARPGRSGSRIGRYSILELVGAGSMGEVFRAYDPRLRREVAIKVMAPRVAVCAKTVARFEREAQAACSLSHPNIVRVYDFSEDCGVPFMVMELVEGRSLRELLDGPLPTESVVSLGAPIADGLASAHAHGVVHRDIKPENILVDARGTPRILDFGLARLGLPPDGVCKGPALDQTGTGMLVGTAGYIAPEAIEGKSGDARADQFALGAILCEMATGVAPFKRRTVEESLLATLREEPRGLRALHPEAPWGLGAVVERCLRKDPAQRYESSRALHQALIALDRRPRRVGRLATGARA
ncbi:MAG TPA: serine/threonine-protein kinase [Thermoanaerobaculia bacterium]|nr:serine/threonine-protein kinase [Thermoanaerobaculia bacterium]